MNRLLDLSSKFAVLIICINADLALGTFNVVSECVCPGSSVQYECSIDGDGFTVWNGTVFNCPLSGDLILLSHADFVDGHSVMGTCNNENIMAHIIQANPYVSQLNISVFNSTLSGRTVECVHQSSQTGDILSLIGASVLMESGRPFPPDNIRLAYVSPEQLTFSWSSSIFNCYGLSYYVESNCGRCSNSSSTFTTCFIDGTTATIGTSCNFAVATVICDNILGSLSDPLNITLRAPSMPNITKVELSYNGVRGYLIAMDVTFTQLDFFNISDGKDGSAVNHTITYNYITTSADCNKVESSNISASSCTAGICNVLFRPTQCASNTTIDFSVSSSNILGNGSAKHTAIKTINSYIHVSYDPASKRITCTFLGELKSNKTKSCIFAYGSCQSLDAQRKKVEIFTTTKFPDIAEMEISFNIERICYTASSTSNDSLFSVKLIDAMIINVMQQSQNTAIISLGVTLAVVIVICLVIVGAFTLFLCKKRCQDHTQSQDETSLNEVKDTQNDSKEPVGRFDHFMVSVEAKCYMYGGQIRVNTETKNRLLKAVRVFDVHTKSWTTIWTEGYPPEPLFEGACCSSSEGIYFYGGQIDHAVYSNKLYHFSTKTGKWQLLNGHLLKDKQLVPMEKIGCGMVMFKDQSGEHLAVVGGSGILQGTKQTGSEFIKCTNHGWTNEFHIFDIKEGCWNNVHGYKKNDDLPPACSHFSFTAVSDSKALLFGGGRANERFNDIYLFDFDQQEVKKIDLGDAAKPVGRSSHAACCLGYGKDYSALLITGGISAMENTLDDVWIFSLSSKKWTKLNNRTLKRCGHSTTALELSQNHYEVVVYGGCQHFDRANPEKVMQRIANTSIGTFEYNNADWQMKGDFTRACQEYT